MQKGSRNYTRVFLWNTTTSLKQSKILNENTRKYLNLPIVETLGLVVDLSKELIMKRLLLTILFISVGLSQQLILDITERYSNGNIKSITYHKKTRNIIEAVKYEDYYIHGQKSYEGTYKDGEKDGLFTGWFGNGNKWGEETWKNGKKDGLSTEWRENGTKKEEGTFKDGKLDGLWTVWYDDGQKKKEETYKEHILIVQIIY